MADEDIERIKAKHAEAVARRLAEENSERERERQTEERASRAARDWIVVWNQIQSIVSTIDDDIRDVGLSLSCQQIDSSDSPAIARVEILLSGASDGKRLILNVNRFGKIQPVLLVPHTGRTVGDFEISEATNERIRKEIINFLDQAVSEPEIRKRR